MFVILDGRHIQDHFPGIGRYVFNLARGLGNAAAGHRIRLLLSPESKNTHYNLDSLASAPNLELMPTRAPVWSIQEQLLGRDRRLMANAALWHSAYYLMPYLLPVPAVVTLEDLIPLRLKEAMPGALNRLIYRALNLFAVHKAAHVITISQAAAQDIKQVLSVPSNRITVIPLAADEGFHAREPVEIERVTDKLGLPGCYVLYLGSNKPHKNLERLVRAWARVVSSATLVIAGHWDGRYDGVQRIVEQLGLKDRVMFRHDVSSDELPALLSGAKVFVFPSLYEGFGLTPLEAMACGAPIVCSNASSLPEVVGDAAILFDPLDVDSISSALTLALQDSARRGSMRAKGLEQAARFSWERTARETRRVYEQVADGQ